MEQKDYWRNITGTVCVVGMTLSAMSFNNTKTLMPVNPDLIHNAGFYADCDYNDTIGIVQSQKSNYYIQGQRDSVLAEAESLFGTMRDATDGELAGVNDYINSIAIETGADFFDLC